jgi:hypothetical protein
MKELISYDPEAGTFVWAVSARGHKRIGKLAGWRDDDGYLFIRLDGVLYAAHRLAWLYMTGEWPLNGFVDHKNTDPSDNRWSNLRDATKLVNQENRRRAGKNNKSGFLGVSLNGKRWAATINTSDNGKRCHHYLGTYDTPEQAHAAYVAAKRRLHAGCTL